jgi:hypothetical protein
MIVVIVWRHSYSNTVMHMVRLSRSHVHIRSWYRLRSIASGARIAPIILFDPSVGPTQCRTQCRTQGPAPVRATRELWYGQASSCKSCPAHSTITALSKSTRHFQKISYFDDPSICCQIASQPTTFQVPSWNFLPSIGKAV